MLKRTVFLLGIAFLLTACAPAAVADTPIFSPVTLQPYSTATPRVTETPNLLIAETPMPTPTPFTHKVKSGETMITIAERYNIPLDVLMAANPGVNPNTMVVGQELLIPGDPKNISGQPLPTPVAVQVEQIGCHESFQEGLWCFALVRNTFPDALDNLTGQVVLLDEFGQQVAANFAFLPLNILPAGAALPLVAYFPLDQIGTLTPSAQVLTGVRILDDDGRYLPVYVQHTLSEVHRSGRFATVSGTIVFPDENSEPANQVWIAAVAYDAVGTVVGVRRWDLVETLAPGSQTRFQMDVSSLAGVIARVELVIEARP